MRTSRPRPHPRPRPRPHPQPSPQPSPDQAIGLQLTSASRSAFLLYLNVKLVPVLAFLLYGRSVPARTWASAAIAVLGTGLLTYDGNPPNAGDAWSLAAALSSAFFILRLEAISRDS